MEAVLSNHDEALSSRAFVSQVRASIVDENIATYRMLLEPTSLETASDPYWRSLLALHGRLSEEDRDIVYAVMRQVAVDTVSNMFAVIDGSARMQGQSEDVELVGAKSRSVLEPLVAGFVSRARRAQSGDAVGVR